ncbi:MAG TPA: hypothetical protein VN903_08430 [Polyangia bacterium]|nr:hypothetical protein [Polyangia bacterium]
MLARNPKQAEGPGLFLLSPSSSAARDGYADTIARGRLRLRRWETRRAWAGRALIALSFPMAYLLVMLSMDAHVSSGAARVLVWLWAAAASVAAVCAEATWRHRVRLDRFDAEVPPRRRR